MKKLMVLALNYFIGGVIIHKVEKENDIKPKLDISNVLGRMTLYTLIVPIGIFGAAESCMDYIAARLSKRG